MRGLKYPILLVLAICAVCLLYGFAGHRASARLIKTPEVRFTDFANPLLSEKSALKILNIKTADSLPIDYLNLYDKEQLVKENPMVRDAQMSIDLFGQTHLVIEQRIPIARVMGEQSGYIDADYLMMPLSREFTPRVPLINGYSKKNYDAIVQLLAFIKNDSYLEKQITEILIDDQDKIAVHVREGDYTLYIGDTTSLNKKLMNYRAFLASRTEKELNNIATIDLRFNGQVVTTNTK